MNVIVRSWSNLKQVFFPLVLLFMVQTWLIFNYPTYLKLGQPWYAIAGSLASVFCIGVLLFTFANLQNRPPIFNFQDWGKDRVAFIFKNIGGFCFAFMCILAIFFIWYKNFYDASNVYYAVMCAQFLFLIILMELTARKKKHV
ncbi:MAG: hypothetical protein BWY54_00674 [Candidatus Dependentiae bacterium ADurb.Bin331]|nr:MAG: hypothetical protein BWY54_00674 [Candidatus Dependentiae bacterium ADurb.Bin331]